MSRALKFQRSAARKLFNKHVDVPYCRPQAVEAVRKLLQDLLGAGETNHQSIIRLCVLLISSTHLIRTTMQDDRPIYSGGRLRNRSRVRRRPVHRDIGDFHKIYISCHAARSLSRYLCTFAYSDLDPEFKFSIVDSFPIFKHVPIWFPGANFQRIAAKIRKLAHDARTLPFEFTEAQVVRQPLTVASSWDNNELQISVERRC